MDILCSNSSQCNPYEKRCSKCKQWKPATTEFFPRDKSRADKLYPHCKQCRKKPSDVEPGYRRCTICKNVFRATDQYFHHHNEGKYGLNSVCKTCAIDRVCAYDQAHPGEKNAYAKIYYQSHKEDRSTYRQGHYQAHREDYYASNQNRRALTRNASGTHTSQQIQEQYERQKGICYYCRDKVKWGEHHIEHVVPLSRGGSNDIDNIVIACSPCNLSKHNKLPHEWFRGGRLL